MAHDEETISGTIPFESAIETSEGFEEYIKQELRRAFTKHILEEMEKEEERIINGTGEGKPLGILGKANG